MILALRVYVVIAGKRDLLLFSNVSGVLAIVIVGLICVKLRAL